MSEEQVSAFLGKTLLLGGLIIAAFWASTIPFESFAGAEVVTHPVYIPGQILHVVGSVLAVIGYVGLYLHIRERTGRFALITFLIAITGAMFFFGDGIVALMVFPVLAVNAPDLITATGPMFTGPVLGLYVVFFATHMIGILLFGLAMLRSGAFPALAVLLFMAGGVAANLPPMPGLHLLLVGGGMAYGLAIAWLGYAIGAPMRRKITGVA